MATTVNVQSLPQRARRTVTKRTAKPTHKQEVKRDVKKAVKKEVRQDLKQEMTAELHRENRKIVREKVRPSIPQAEDFSQIVKAFAMPGEAPPVRYASEYTTRPTATAAPWSKGSAAWPTQATAVNQDLTTKNEYGCYAFRDPFRAFVK